MKVRIQETIEFDKNEVQVLKKMAEEWGFSSWRAFVSWRVCSNGHGELNDEISGRLNN